MTKGGVLLIFFSEYQPDIQISNINLNFSRFTRGAHCRVPIHFNYRAGKPGMTKNYCDEQQEMALTTSQFVSHPIPPPSESSAQKAPSIVLELDVQP
jgi:hypothetical protein